MMAATEETEGIIPDVILCRGKTYGGAAAIVEIIDESTYQVHLQLTGYCY